MAHVGSGDSPSGTSRFLTSEDRLALVYGKDKKRRVFWLVNFDLTEEHRIDGTWSFDIYYRGTSLHTEKFELANCG